MPPTRPRRIVRRAVMALAVVVLLPVGYLGSYWGLHWAYGARFVSDPTFESLTDTVYKPLFQYEWSDSPGGQRLQELTIAFLLAGAEFREE